ncbi:ABC transporter permease [Dermacoccaceae bacterium W4C1]
MNLLRESVVVFRRQLRINLRNPAWLVLGASQPVLYLLLFAPLLGPLAQQLNAKDPLTFFVPGLVVQLGLFGALYVGFSLLAEWRDGVIEAERVTPASRMALLLGRLGRDVFQLLVQCLILVGLAYALGMRATLWGAALGIVIALLLGAAGSALSNAVALRTKSEEVMAPLINVVTMPVLLLSGILLPMTLGPDWLQRVSEALPTRYVVDGVRAAFAGDIGSSSLHVGLLVTAGLLTVGLWSAAEAFRRDDA